MNVPNTITFIRIALIPVLVLTFYIPGQWSPFVCSGIFALAAFTDWLDGYLARNLKQTSQLGTFLDPVADKLIVAVALVLVVSENSFSTIAIPACIIVGREIVISALREWMAEIGKRASVAVSYIGKLKTFFQMISLILLLAYRPGGWYLLGIVGYGLLCIAAAMTLWSMLIYLKTAWPDLTLHQKQQ
jgi:CDP-diacylglycerol--glycerol-3-phosphate 3-phosphatidyltransferase